VIRVATFNARHAADDGRRPLRALHQTCAALDADVLAVQELDRHVIRTWFRDQPRRLARALRYAYAFAPAKHLGPGGRQCNALYVRGALRDVEVVELPRPEHLEPRNAIVARAVCGAGELTVACTHLQHRPRADARPQLERVLQAMRARPGPHVLAGDLNLATAEAVPLLRAAGFEPVEVGPSSPRVAPREQIDWVAHDGLTLVEGRLGEASLSDHLPVVATFAPPRA
jgi:endonuclease/exonuclease/phosphatase family metal-dependent hydrolase